MKLNIGPKLSFFHHSEIVEYCEVSDQPNRRYVVGTEKFLGGGGKREQLLQALKCPVSM